MSSQNVNLQSLLLAWIACCLAGPVAGAVDSSLDGRKLVIVDGGLSGRSKVILSAKGSGVVKGFGNDPTGISLGLAISRGDVSGGFAVPSGDFSNNNDGWRENSSSAARYLNRDASSGTPTGVKSLSIKPGKSLRVVARTLGDEVIDLATMGADTAGIRVVATVTNAGEVYRLCTWFPGDEVKFAGPSASGRYKVIARHGSPTACPGLTLTPSPDLPAAPTDPYLYFDGGDPVALGALMSRITAPATSGQLASFHGFVDGALAGINSASDDTRSKVAKAAGLLHVLGKTPPGASGFATYGEVAVTALLGIVDRTALDSIDEFVTPPANLLNVLQDSGRLQSICEAYDFLRAATVDPVDDADIRTLVASWADAFVGDWNLIGDPFGVFEGHRDNWAVKAGAALITAALALPDHGSAPTWLATGLVYVNESLEKVVLSPGWYSESPHYVNYSLNNLASTAWHVQNATGDDWFDDLAPLVDTALALRQPDGESAPFEEGLPNVFPHDVLAAAYPTRAPRMLWAWDESTQNTGNYDNQQIHSVTRFLVRDTATASAPPTVASTVFLDGDANAIALRSEWDLNATQLTSIAALDHSAAELFESRHNMENPLDITFFAAGAMLLPTASGGPEVTSSTNRAYYLEPSSKNIPLVDGNAPYILDPLQTAMSERLDSADAGGITHRVLDCATTEVSEFAAGVDVTRTVALVADEYGVVLDRFESNFAHDYATTWRGRGNASVRSALPSHHGVDYAWPSTATATAYVAVDVGASAGLAGLLDTGLYASAWGQEESVSPLRVSATSTALHSVTVLRPRLDTAPASTITSIGSGDIVGFRIDDLVGDVVVASRGGATFSADGVSSDAHLAVVRRQAGNATSLAMVSGTTIEAGASVESDRVATFSVTADSGTIVVTISPDATAKTRVTIADLPGVDGSADHTATLDGLPLEGSAFTQSGAEFSIRVAGGGTVVIQPVP